MKVAANVSKSACDVCYFSFFFALDFKKQETGGKGVLLDGTFRWPVKDQKVQLAFNALFVFAFSISHHARCEINFIGDVNVSVFL